MNRVADTHNNPFFVDDESLPPQRSAFAVLLAERDDLLGQPVEELLERAKAHLQRDPQLATVYGRSVTEEDLNEAATRLSNPGDRLVNEILDFHFHTFDLQSIPELAQATDTFRKSLARWEWPELVDLSLIASIINQNLEPIEPPSLTRHAPKPPELPDLVAMINRSS